MKPTKIEKTITTAQKVYSDYAEELKNSLGHLLEEARHAVEKSRYAYINLGINEICRRCDEEEGGSCCGAGIEDRYTVELLLANMLSGTFPPSSRLNKNSCYFLGERGCVLLFRHILCVNFLCKKLYDMLGTERIIFLQNIIGEEIELTFKLCNAITQIVRYRDALYGKSRD